MFRAASALVALNALAVGNAVTPWFTTYFGGSRNDFAQHIAVDLSGNIYIAGSTNSSDLPGPLAPFSAAAPQFKTCFLSAVRSYDCTPPEGFVAKLSADGSKVLYSAYFGDQIVGIAVDQAGNLYIAGLTTSDTLPVTNGTRRQNTPSGFLTEVAAGGAAILFSTFLNVTPTALAIDTQGNPLLGTTDNNVIQYNIAASTQHAFTGTGPVTAIAVGPTGMIAATGGSYAPVSAIIDPSTGRVTTHLLLPNNWWNATPDAIAIDLTGSVYAAGAMNLSNMPGLFVAGPYTVFLGGGGGATGIAVDVSTRADVVGGTTSFFPPAPGAPSSLRGAGCIGIAATGGPTFSECLHGFLAQLDSAGLTTYATYWGLDAETTVNAVATDSAGAVYIAGWSRSAALLTTAGVLQENLAPGTCQTVASIMTAPGHATIDSPCADAFVAKLSIPTASTAPLLVSSASYALLPIAPGALVSLFGHGLGPQTGVVATPSAGAGFATSLGGVRVLFDGVPAPLLYVQDAQINAIVPFGIATQGRTHVQIVYNDTTIEAGNYVVGSASPGVFTLNAAGYGPAAIINQDLSINGPLHPAPKGSIISIYATGAGQTAPASTDGALAGSTPPVPVNSISVWFQTANPLSPFVSGEVTYYGGAPTLVNGVLQVNVRVPDGAMSGESVQVFLKIGNQASQPDSTLAIR